MQFGVVAGDVRAGNHDVVVGRPADAQCPGQPGWLHGHCALQDWPVRRIAEAHHALSVDLDLVYQPTVSEGSVRALVIG
jgi:hypothetical protein